MNIQHLRDRILTIRIGLKRLNSNLQRILLLFQSLKKSNQNYLLNNHQMFLRKNLIILITWKLTKLLKVKSLQWSNNLQITLLKRRVTLKHQNQLMNIQSATSTRFKRNWSRSKQKRMITTVITKALSSLPRAPSESSSHNREPIKMTSLPLHLNPTKTIQMTKDMNPQSVDSSLMNLPTQDKFHLFNLNKEKISRTSLVNHRKLVNSTQRLES